MLHFHYWLRRTADNPNAEQVYYSRSTLEESIAVKSALFLFQKIAIYKHKSINERPRTKKNPKKEELQPPIIIISTYEKFTIENCILPAPTFLLNLPSHTRIEKIQRNTIPHLVCQAFFVVSRSWTTSLAC